MEKQTQPYLARLQRMWRAVCLLSVLCLTSLAVAASFQLPDISKTVPVNVRLLSNAEPLEHTYVFSEPGASFIKVHFSQLTLNDGVVVEVSSPNRSEVYHYGTKHSAPRTMSGDDDGIERFSAMSVTGDTVEVRLLGDGGQSSAVIDHIQVGLPEPQVEQQLNGSDVETESICGNSDDKRGASCFEFSHPTEYQHSKPVARILIDGRKYCTAWRVGADNHVITNNHCVGNAREAASAELWFNFQQKYCGGERADIIKVSVDQLLETDWTLDVSLLTVKDFDAIRAFGYLGLDPRIPEANETIYIPQHAGGRFKELGIFSDSQGNRCQVDKPVTDGRGIDTNSGYLCDTEGGSSGSPVIAASSNNVVALHHLGGCYNKGAHISKIWPLIESHFPNGVPNSHVGEPGMLPPTAVIDVECDARQCEFDASRSTQSDDNIVSYYWRFGDGVSSALMSSPHLYASDGDYLVSLTVTDYKGQSHKTSKWLSVQSLPTERCGGLAEWQSDASYQAGDKVHQEQHQYQAKWWNKGESPDEHSGSDDAWLLLGYCQ